MRKIDHVIIHCAATTADMDIGTTEIDKWHRARGWFGCGYHYVIRRDGTVESHANGNRCRPLEKAGAHVGDCGRGWNRRSVGICMVGGITPEGNAEDNFTVAQFESLAGIVKTFPGTTIMGHRDLIKQTNASPKACPSFDVAEWLASLSN